MNYSLIISKVKFFFIIIFFLVSFIKCDREDFKGVPYVPIDYSIDIINQMNLGQNESAIITPIDNFTSQIEYPLTPSKPASVIQYRTYGNGIIIFKTFDEYIAYDLTCTYLAQEDYCAVEYEASTTIRYICPCCGSIFNLAMEAYPEKESKAALPLKRYNTTVYGNELLIRN